MWSACWSPCRALWAPPTELLPVAQVEFESGAEPAVELPPTLMDNSTVLVLVDERNPSVHVEGNVSEPGRYVLVVHYYQVGRKGASEAERHRNKRKSWLSLCLAFPRGTLTA